MMLILMQGYWKLLLKLKSGKWCYQYREDRFHFHRSDCQSRAVLILHVVVVPSCCIANLYHIPCFCLPYLIISRQRTLTLLPFNQEVLYLQ